MLDYWLQYLELLDGKLQILCQFQWMMLKRSRFKTVVIFLIRSVYSLSMFSEELPESSALSVEQKKSIRELFKSYYDSLYSKTEKTCSARNKAMKRVKRQERSRGDAGDEEKTTLNDLQSELDSLRKMVQKLITQ